MTVKDYGKDITVTTEETNPVLAKIKALADEKPALESVANPYNTFESNLARAAGGYPTEASNPYNTVESIVETITSVESTSDGAQ